MPTAYYRRLASQLCQPQPQFLNLRENRKALYGQDLWDLVIFIPTMVY